MHLPSHARSPGAQLSKHTPRSQTCAPEHWLPQAPQLVISDCSSTQSPEHRTSPVLQAKSWHFPSKQPCSAPHSVPQLPQWLASISTDVQISSQSICDSSHVPASPPDPMSLPESVSSLSPQATPKRAKVSAEATKVRRERFIINIPPAHYHGSR